MNKTAIVTGGSKGIGKAICVRLAKDGFNIAFSYNSNPELAEETAKLCESAGVKVKFYKVDVADSTACKEWTEEVQTEFGSVDVLVNNAGITKDGLLMKMKDEDLDAVLDVNLKGSFYMMREASKIMLKQKSGKIVNISSVVGVMGNAGQVNYSATKAGVIGMTKSLARELAGRRINVNAVAPGMIETDMTKAMSDKAREAVIAGIPFKEMGKPEEIASVVSFLAGEDSNYITGQVICADGGMSI
ncbi:3-oxoacyl-[acyl-carrier-protein] reductase [Catonella morbi ATCC 51271]|uniref:3-oxoacyl-[acyl-carrier-protein] reductase n=1 Tax=Catonella morbi ATCC 51271 TaxID=592026 RepID=V2XIL4_9FIRM|nr:3-oxoacyl-[acyl-carrier-protein] reductase [Catonella morbi]ESL02014.1 3-oxoacyl-[acyl-carrier-protein] reductase [Catonella morbi ATCC 51271]